MAPPGLRRFNPVQITMRENLQQGSSGLLTVWPKHVFEQHCSKTRRLIRYVGRGSSDRLHLGPKLEAVRLSPVPSGRH